MTIQLSPLRAGKVSPQSLHPVVASGTLRTRCGLLQPALIAAWDGNGGFLSDKGTRSCTESFLLSCKSLS